MQEEIAALLAPIPQQILSNKFSSKYKLIPINGNLDEPLDLYQKWIVQLDIEDLSNFKGRLPGLHWLEKTLSDNEQYADRQIIITAWNPFLLPIDDWSKVQEYYQTKMLSNFLESRLIDFKCISQLLNNNIFRSKSLFPEPLDISNRYDSLLLKDIYRNSYHALNIENYFHKIKARWRQWIPKDGQFNHPEQVHIIDDINYISELCIWNSSQATRKAIEKLKYSLIKSLNSEISSEDKLHEIENFELKLIWTRDRKIQNINENNQSKIAYLTDDVDFAINKIGPILAKHHIELMCFSPAEFNNFLENSINEVCCFFSDYRFYQQKNKLDRTQGYYYMEQVRLKHQGVARAFITGRTGIYAETQHWLKVPIFSKNPLAEHNVVNELSEFLEFTFNAEKRIQSFKSSVSGYFSLKNPKLVLDQYRLIFSDNGRYLDEIYEKTLESVRKFKPNSKDGIPNKELTARPPKGEFIDDKIKLKFLIKRLIWRLTIISILRLSETLFKGQDHYLFEDRLQIAIDYLFYSTRKKRKIPNKKTGRKEEAVPNTRKNINEFLRIAINNSYEIYESSPAEMLRRGYLLPHEPELLLKIEKTILQNERK